MSQMDNGQPTTPAAVVLRSPESLKAISGRAIAGRLLIASDPIQQGVHIHNLIRKKRGIRAVVAELPLPLHTLGGQLEWRTVGQAREGGIADYLLSHVHCMLASIMDQLIVKLSPNIDHLRTRWPGYTNTKEICIWGDLKNPKLLLDESEWDHILTLLAICGTNIDRFMIRHNDSAPPWALPSYAWYPRDFVGRLLKSAVQTGHPESFVRDIKLDIPPNSGIDFAGQMQKALEDQQQQEAASAIRLVTKGKDGLFACKRDEYELKNLQTGRRFRIELHYRGGYGSNISNFCICRK